MFSCKLQNIIIFDTLLLYLFHKNVSFSCYVGLDGLLSLDAVGTLIQSKMSFCLSEDRDTNNNSSLISIMAKWTSLNVLFLTVGRFFLFHSFRKYCLYHPLKRYRGTVYFYQLTPCCPHFLENMRVGVWFSSCIFSSEHGTWQLLSKHLIFK